MTRAKPYRPKEGSLPRPVMYSKLPDVIKPQPGHSKMRFAEDVLFAKAETRRFMREHPEIHTPPVFKIAEYRYADVRKTKRKVYQASRNVRVWVDKYFPDDVWGIHVRKVPDSWGEFELYIQFWGTDPPEAERRRKERRAAYERQQESGRLKRRLRAEALEERVRRGE